MKNLKTVFFLLCISTPFFIIAQNNKNIEKAQSYILTDISFQNDAVFMGRRDSITAPYIVPSLGYYDASGFFADASLSYLTKSNENRVDLFLLTAGYHFDSNKLSGAISGTKYFFNDNSYSIQSEIEADVSAFISYDFDILEASILASSYFSKDSNTDFFVGAQLAKSLYTTDKSLEITPTIAAHAGSQYFYQEYYQYNRVGNRKGNGTNENQQIGTTIVGIDEVNKFNLLNIELSLPIHYYSKSFIFSFSPHLAFPQGNATIVTEDAIIKEDLKEVFYFSAGISYWFNTSKSKTN
ncbi:hypothetical protein QO200_03085 [Flavobacterium sp. Arc3]|uniref:hypothetical protein n=1 Tax=unclassified Flavobacterium TaxID=196869 RepID=UPI00352CF28F